MVGIERMPDGKRRRAVVVEDDAGVRRSLQLLLQWRGYDVRSYACAVPALRSEDVRRAEVLIADYRLPDSDGIALLMALREQGWQGRAVLITAFPDSGLIESARASGYEAVLEKPLRQQELIDAIAA